MFGRKKLTVLPLEAKKQGALDRQNEYLQAVSRYPASKLHFFDEPSIIKTTGNCKYGIARVSERAIKVQRYASNATFANSKFLQLDIRCVGRIGSFMYL